MKMTGCTHVVPSQRVTNDDMIEKILDCSRKYNSSSELDRLRQRILEAFELAGTKFRYHRSSKEKAGDLTALAGETLLKETGVNSSDVDMLIYAGVGRGCLEPSMANIFLDKLGLKNATGFDVIDACASWLRSAEIAKQYINQGICNTVMILNSEFNFREYANFEIKELEDINHMLPAFTIGEAATATLFSGSEDKESFYFTFKNWSNQHHLCMIPLPNIEQYTSSKLIRKSKPLTFFADSKKLTRFTMSKMIKHYKSDNILSSNYYDIVFGHAPSEASSSYWMKSAGLDDRILYRTHANYGNTVSASIPLAISLSLKEGKLKRGMRVLTVVGSAGVVTSYCNFIF